jgi:organic hydroperoxide reductase OsmC/OhrA
MMKTQITKAKVFVTARFKSEGSVLRETVQAVGLGFETRCELESTEPAEKVAAVVRNAENGCFVLQSILNPVPVERKFTLNGAELHPEGFRTNKR